MKNKKGVMIIETAIKIILVIGALIGLAYLIFVLYGLFADENEKIKAESTLKEFIITLQDVEKNKGKSLQFIFTNPEGWFVAFPFGLRPGKFIPPPDVCRGKNCVCICEDDSCNRIFACENVGSEMYQVSDGKELSAYFEIPGSGIEYNVRFSEVNKKYLLYKNGV